MFSIFLSFFEIWSSIDALWFFIAEVLDILDPVSFRILGRLLSSSSHVSFFYGWFPDAWLVRWKLFLITLASVILALHWSKNCYETFILVSPLSVNWFRNFFLLRLITSFKLLLMLLIEARLWLKTMGCLARFLDTSCRKCWLLVVIALFNWCFDVFKSWLLSFLSMDETTAKFSSTRETEARRGSHGS